MRMLMLSSVFLGLLAGCAESRNAEADARLAVARQMIEAWNERNWEGVYALFAEDGVLHSVMKEPVVGRDAIRQQLRYIEEGVDRIELQVVNMGVIDEVVFIERIDDFHFRGRHGRVPVVGVLEIEDGKVQEWREYYDRATLENAVAEQ